MLKVFLVEDEAVIRDGLRDKIPWEQYGFRFVGFRLGLEKGVQAVQVFSIDYRSESVVDCGCCIHVR